MFDRQCDICDHCRSKNADVTFQISRITAELNFLRGLYLLQQQIQVILSIRCLPCLVYASNEKSWSVLATKPSKDCASSGIGAVPRSAISSLFACERNVIKKYLVVEDGKSMYVISAHENANLT
jgi:hypothetical protein